MPFIDPGKRIPAAAPPTHFHLRRASDYRSLTSEGKPAALHGMIPLRLDT